MTSSHLPPSHGSLTAWLPNGPSDLSACLHTAEFKANQCNPGVRVMVASGFQSRVLTWTRSHLASVPSLRGPSLDLLRVVQTPQAPSCPGPWSLPLCTHVLRALSRCADYTEVSSSERLSPATPSGTVPSLTAFPYFPHSTCHHQVCGRWVSTAAPALESKEGQGQVPSAWRGTACPCTSQEGLTGRLGGSVR